MPRTPGLRGRLPAKPPGETLCDRLAWRLPARAAARPRLPDRRDGRHRRRRLGHGRERARPDLHHLPERGRGLRLCARSPLHA